MVDEGIFATTAEVQRKVNVNASATSNVEAYINQYMTEAESMINVTTERNWSDDFAGLNVDVKGILKMAASELAAWMVEQFDIDAIGRATAALSAEMHLQKYNMALTELKRQQAQDFIDTTT